ARNKGYLSFNSEKIEIFPDLPREALLKRRELKPLTTKLTEEDIRYSWISPLILQFTHRGKVYRITNKEEGFKILNSLDIVTQFELSQQSLKRKQRSSSPSPPQSPERQEVEHR
ncbi:UNVERIFIED_CONTAM: hypothetical protein K2H54_000205, partial [Gekko kuhli]